jgi:hypothetical protein
MHGPDCPPIYAPFSPTEGLLDSLGRIRRHLKEQEIVVAANPEDVTDEMRALVAAAPLMTLRESRFIERGRLFVIHPGLLGDLAA